MKKLSDYAHGKDNNFNLIRILAALAVLVTHSFALATGQSSAEPFRDTLGMTMGAIAVDVFFVTSGFLVTGSLLSRKSTVDFVIARMLRIYPALVIMVFITVFGLGLYFTTLSASAYLHARQTWLYLIKTSTLVLDVAFNLPGVFDEIPYKNAVNGSLWTMPYEIRMYGILVLTWIALRQAKSRRPKLLKAAVVLASAIAGVLVMASFAHVIEASRFIKLFFMFFSGAAFYVLKDRIPLHAVYFWPALLALLGSALVGTQVFGIVYHLTLAYVLFYLAYVPAGPVRHYNRLGDYSYGVYIFAFPVQQSIIALNPGISTLGVIVSSAAVTIVLAVLSWHLIEKRALSLKLRYVGWTQKMLATGTPR
jgi:peptidoglycan/LPS O-acetylase OafA/YrhL